MAGRSAPDRVWALVRPLVPPRVRAKLAAWRQARAVDPVSQVMAAFGAAHPDAVFVQIGANDGQQRDPLLANIAAHDWSGVMLEPVPYVFARLAARYGDHPRVHLHNVAIASEDGTRRLYYLPQSDDASLPQWYDALASFRPEVILSHERFIPDVAERMASMEVPCWTFDTLCRRESIERVDVVQIDTEGYDFEVIKTIDLERHAPKLVMYESLHLSEDDRAACSALLEHHGYQSFSDGMDTVCIRTDALDSSRGPLPRTWQRVQRLAPERAPASP